MRLTDSPQVEKHLIASGLSYTILRPVAFMVSLSLGLTINYLRADLGPAG